MSAARKSNRLIASSLVFAALGLVLIWVFVLKPRRDAIEHSQHSDTTQEGEAPFSAPQTQLTARVGQKVELRKAAERGDWQQIETALAHGMNINADLGVRTLLITAAQYGKVELLQKLLAAGAKIDLRDQYGNTALLYAARFGQNEAINALLQHGADITAQNRANLNAIDLALIGQHKATYELLKNGKLTINLLQAVTAHDEDHLKKLLEQGADANAACLSGVPQSPREQKSGLVLAFASSAGGGEPAHPAYDQAAPLSGALKQQQWKAAELLLAHGAKVDQPDKSGWTPLMHAAKDGNLDAAKFLLRHSARTDIKTKDNLDALQLASQSRNNKAEIERLLQEASAKSQTK